ncbi:MAG: O-methyltransferase [Odoribacteraceae bacterium]|jgi:predicted O-methyltransferase YrrM|nr:O-methyltransferase [Odoribacteraceae bacterium]
MNEELERYTREHGTPEPDLLAALYRETRARTVYPRMASGWAQGSFLRMTCRLLSARRVLEIGTFTGYAAIAMASGLADDGVLHTIDRDDEVADLAREYIERAGLSRRVVFHAGDALRVIPALREVFDLVFIDGDKREYPEYYRLAREKTRPGGLIIADDVLWDGKVLRPPALPDPRTAGILAFNDMVQQDPGVENILLPLRHGLMMIRVKENEPEFAP